MEDLTPHLTIVFLALALSRTVLVLDGVLAFHGYGSVVSRMSFCCRDISSPVGEGLEELGGAAAQASHSSGSESPRNFR